MVDLGSFFASRPGDLRLEDALLAILLAFVLGQAIAWVYMYTHAALSYSRAFVQSLVVLTVILCVGMMVIGHSFAIAFGLIGALSVIRFRNILKDTRDTAFIFSSLIVGMACGTGSYALAVAGAASFCLILFYLYWTGFGSRYTSDGFVRLYLSPESGGQQGIQDLFSAYCRSSQLVSQRLGEDDYEELAYRLYLRDTSRAPEFVQELRALDGVSNITFALQEDEAEV